MTQRLYRFDNLKFILMFLVVFAHFLEISASNEITNNLYRIIYSFHMPAFIFISGYFAKYNPQKILTTYLWPYILLQTIYLIFIYYFIAPSIEPKTIQYSAPYWVLWYLLAMVGFHLLLPVFDTKNKYLRLVTLIITSAISLLSGYDSYIGVAFGMSKIVVFLPFFLLGYYVRNSDIDYLGFKKKYKAIIFCIATIGVIASALIIAKKDIITAKMMYAQYSYASIGYNPILRGFILAAAILWIVFLMYAPLLDKKILFITAMGKYTFPVFVFHGIIHKIIGKYYILGTLPGTPIVKAFLITALVMLVLGNPLTDKAFRYLFTLDPILKLTKRKQAQ